MLPAAHAPAELVKLRQAKPVRPVDEDDAGVWNVHSNLDDGRGHQNVQLPAPEPLHHTILFLEWHAAMEQSNGEVREDLGREPFILGGRSPGLNASDSSIRGQMTKACRPSLTWPRMWS